jgi:hypothetical protein
MTWSTSALSIEEAARAIYVDYEGTPFTPPTLLGVRADGKLDQWIIEDAFHDFANRRNAKASNAEHTSLASKLVERACNEDRRIVAWSTHDAKLMADVLDPRRLEDLQDVFRNAIKTARRWRRRYRPEVQGPHQLSSYMDMLAWQVPDEAGPGVVGRSLRVLRSRLAAGNGFWREMSDADKDRWRNVLRHNRHDLNGMEKVVVRICDALGAPG